MEERRTSPRADRKESMLGLVVYSPVIYLFVFLISFMAHVVYPVSLRGGEVLFWVGVFFMFVAPFLILWSQRSIATFRKREEKGAPGRTFAIGPYRFSRNPTYLGLTFLTLGFSFMMNSLWMLFGVILSFHIVNIAVVRREEALLRKKYGDDYEAYRSKVRPWL